VGSGRTFRLRKKISDEWPILDVVVIADRLDTAPADKIGLDPVLPLMLREVVRPPSQESRHHARL